MNNHIFGIHSIVEALRAETQIEKIYILKTTPNDRLNELRNLAMKNQVPLQYVPIEKLQTLAFRGNHQGAVATISTMFYQSLEDIIKATLEANKVPLFVMLDGVTDVRNVGAIARSMECMGANALIVPISGGAALNADAMKVSAGALNFLPVCREKHLLDATYLLKEYGVQLIACTEKAKDTFFSVDFKEPTCLILGSEEKGISPTLLKAVTQQVKIPMQGQISSLNVSVAAGMILSEVVRQRLSL